MKPGGIGKVSGESFQRPESRAYVRPKMPRLLSLACLLACLMFAGCDSALQRADLVVVNGAEPDSLDPAKIRGQPEGRVAYALFEGLTRYNEHGESEPGVAERWEISPDGKHYTFHLRANAKWNNGDPVTAHDFVWSWLRAMREPECEYRYQFYYIVGAEAYGEAKGKRPPEESVAVRAVDDRTLTVELKNPTPFFLDLCTFYTLMPLHRATLEKAEKEGVSWIRPGRLVNNGPYLLEAWRLSDRIRLRKNPHYWDNANTRMNTVDMLPMASPNTALNFYHSGVADLILDKSMVPTSLVSILKQRPDYHSAPILATYFVRFNVTRKPFDDVRVRKAFSLVVDKQMITEKVTQAGEVPANAFTPPGTAGYQPPAGLERDPELARKLLAEAGFPGGANFPVVRYLYTNRSEADDKIAVELQAMFKRELGVNVQLAKQEWAVYLNSQSGLDFDLSRSSWVGDYKDPNTFLDMFLAGGGNNNTGWINQRYDELIHKAAIETDKEKRHALFREAETILVRDEVPVLPLYTYVVIMMYDGDRLGGVRGNITDEHPVRAMYWKKP
jgi:oligopeptide transport system substrate-binding protein